MNSYKKLRDKRIMYDTIDSSYIIKYNRVTEFVISDFAGGFLNMILR